VRQPPEHWSQDCIPLAEFMKFYPRLQLLKSMHVEPCRIKGELQEVQYEAIVLQVLHRVKSHCKQTLWFKGPIAP